MQLMEGNNMKLQLSKVTVSEISHVSRNYMRVGLHPFRPDQRHSDCFVYVLNGSAKYTFLDTSFTVEKGDVFYLSHTCRYEIMVGDGFQVIYIDCMLNCPDYKKGSGEKIAENAFGVEQTFEQIYKSWKKYDNTFYVQTFSKLYFALVQLIEIQESNSASIEKNLQIISSRKEIENNFSNNNFSIESLSKKYGYSVSHLRKLFTKQYCISPVKYLIHVRIHIAKRLLTESDNSIKNKAEMVGYKNEFYFSRAFKMETGMTASEYRQR